MKTNKGIWLPVMQFLILITFSLATKAQLQAGFSAEPTTGCPPMVVNFIDSSKGNPTGYKWDLGNGTISYLQNPIATYFNPGSYTVKLVVQNAEGVDSVVKSQYIVVNAPPVADFSSSDTTGCFPLKINFFDSSAAGSGTITDWQWDFGDGTLSNEANPSHIYTNPGSFTVILRVVNSNGCSKVITKPGFIKIKDGVKAGFSLVNTQLCRPPAAVNFTNETQATGNMKYSWQFGDGTTSSDESPVHNYANAGVYSVKLIAVNSYGCTDTVFKPNAVTINSMKAAFTNPATICAGSSFNLTNNSSPTTYAAVNWDFGDSTFSNSPNAVKQYDKPGTYNIKLVVHYETCDDSIIHVIDVLPRPTVNFSVSNAVSCKAPITAQFTSVSNGAVSYLWDFGDGTTSTLKDPSHTYTSVGKRTVTLTVTNASGCKETFSRTNAVKINPPKILGINNLNVKGCLPLSISPIADIADSMPVSSYLWDFGDGTTSTEATPSHTYTKVGTFTVSLSINTDGGCSDAMTVSNAVQTGNRPKANFSADPRDVCAFTPVEFSDLTSSEVATDWFWLFGDGGTSIEQNPKHAYNDTGYFKVTLVAFSYGCSDTLIRKDYVHVSPPIAKFDTLFNCSDPLTRSFVNSSIGATTWQWEFGDGSTSTLENPSHTYAAPGTYKVVLNVSNGSCQHQTKKDVLVVKEAGALTVSNGISCINTRLVFNVSNVNAANISTYAWYFNGLSQSSITTGNNPVASQYNSAGVRNAAVIITDVLKCKDTMYLSTPVVTYGPRVAFSSVNPNTCFGNTVKFSDSTKTDGTHKIVDFEWSFGEGNSEHYTAGPFEHDYTSTGVYDVKLKVKDSFGCMDSLTKVTYVSITKPVAAIEVSDTLICPSAPVRFKNNSNGVGVQYFWSFGDGDTTSIESPSHKYKDTGVYTVRMLMIDKNGCSDSAFSTIRVFTATAAFNLSDSFSTCPPLIVNITNQSANFTSLNWDFGDGGNSQLGNPSHIYTYPGKYSIQLSVRNNGGCTDTLTRNVEIQGPTGIFDYFPKQVCNPGTVNYELNAKNAVKYIWDYNDGTTIFSTKVKSNHTYTTPGIYLPKIILEDASGCRVAVTGTDTIKVNGIRTSILSDTKLLCDSGYVAFTDSSLSNDVIKGYVWNFGDGTTSTEKNPSHSYTKAGFYDVSLVAHTAFGCTDSATIVNCVKLVKSPVVNIIGDSSACEPAMLAFKGNIAQQDTSTLSWNWNFGNGDTARVQQPGLQNYKSAGTYAIKVKVTNSDGCSNVASKKAVVHPIPTVVASQDTTICLNSKFNLQVTGADTYQWNNDPSLSCTNCATPAATPKARSTYFVKGKTVFGCENSDSVTVNVKLPFTMQVEKGDTLCAGESYGLKAAGADFYQWTPSLGLSNNTVAAPTSKPQTTTTYQVVGSDSLNCFKDTGYVTVKVYPVPTVEITNGDNVVLQVGKTLNLATKTTGGVTNYKWFPGQWLSCGDCAEPTTSPKDNISYNLTVSNEGNCTASDNITINLICGNANVYMPNTFTPNGDGANDVFYPRGTGLYNIKSFRIFNRWGQLVFSRDGISANDPAYGWNGQLNGKELQSDVYVYLLEVVCANNIVFPFKGNVTLIR